jgi:hypothetical protein
MVALLFLVGDAVDDFHVIHQTVDIMLAHGIGLACPYNRLPITVSCRAKMARIALFSLRKVA